MVSQKNWNKLNTERIRLLKALAKSRKNFLQKQKKIIKILENISRFKALQKLFKKRTNKIITREIHNIKKLKIKKYCKASVTTFKPVDIKFNNFIFFNLFFWNLFDFFFGNFKEPLKHILDFL